MFEHLSLECLQCGLSWDLMLKKREIFRRCFAQFDFQVLAHFTDADVEQILEVEGMLKSRRKIEAILQNARCACAIVEEFGSFAEYFWNYSNHKVILYKGHNKADGQVPTKNGLSKRISKDLKKRGFKYVGEITIYSHLQACGIINDHDVDCPRYKYILDRYPTIVLEPDQEGKEL